MTELPTNTVAIARATINITVGAVDDPFEVNATPVNGIEDQTLDVDLRNFVRDVDSPLTGLTFTLGATSNAQVSLQPDGHTARLTFAPNYSGPASFSFNVTDGTTTFNNQSVSINVAAVNDAPTVTVPTANLTLKDTQTLSLADVTIADIDSTNLTLTVSVSTGLLQQVGSKAAKFVLTGTAEQINTTLDNMVFIPQAGESVIEALNVEVTDDAQTKKASGFLIGVRANTAPQVDASSSEVLIPEGNTASQIGSFLDADGDEVTLTASVGSITKNDDGTWTWVGSAPTTSGPYSFDVTITASDPDNTSSSTTFTVSVVNGAPTDPIDINSAANTISDRASNGDLVGITVNSTDFAGDTVTYSLTNDAGGRFQIDPTTGVVTVKDARLLNSADATGHIITVQASDGSLSTARDFTITVTANDPVVLHEGTINIETVGNTMTVRDSDPAANNVIRVKLDDGSLLLTFGNVQRRVSLRGCTTLVFDTGAGDDEVTVDLSGGALPLNVTFNGGDGGHDTLKVVGFNAAGNLDAITSTYSGLHDGQIDLRQGATVRSSITYTGLEPISIDGTPAEIIFNLPSTNDGDVTLSDIGGADGVLRLSGSTFESTDFSVGNATSIVINGLGGHDRITVQSIDTTYTGLIILDGGEGNDTLTGSINGDRILGGIGDDLIDGGSGNDSVLAGDGVDTVTGGDGNDSLDGGSGNDRIFGGDGDDVIMGLTGADRIEAGAGNDYVYGGNGNDTIDGGTGNDVLQGQENDDSLSGNDGDDSLYGLNGNDVITGGLGDDLFNGGNGTDLLFELGNINLVLMQDSKLTGMGTDTLVGIEAGRLAGGGGNNTIDASQATIPVTLSGASGDDVLLGSKLGDVLWGESGNDTLIGGAGADSLDGQVGNDELQGGEGDDSLVGGAGIDRIREAGDVNFALTNVLLTQYTNLKVIVSRDTLNLIELAELSGGSSRNLFDLQGFTEGLGTTIIGNNGHDVVYGSPATDSVITGTGHDLVYGNGGADIIYTGSGNDTIYGGDGGDILGGQNGNDVVNGEAGNDILIGAAGLDTLNGGADNDFLSGQQDAGLLIGGSGDDTLLGHAGNDTLQGDSGNDRLYGLQGNDVITGGDDNDWLLGGIGNDTLNGDAGIDSLSGELGSDIMDGGADADQMIEMFDTNVIILANTLIAGALGMDTFTNVERLNLQGGSASNLFDGRQATIQLYLTGAEGADTLLGGSRNDVLIGNTGNDVLSGGAGTDMFDGGDGIDYLLEKADTNFAVNGSTISSAATGTETPVNVERIALIGGAGANILDASLANLPVVLIGGRGNDTLLGGSGADTLSGGNRNDATVVGGDGTDSLDGGGSVDVYENDAPDTKAQGAGDSSINDVFTLLPSWVDTI